ncbi:MAG: lipopolysaccharide biosynthesis protein [Methanobacterium sp.]|nr:lipopolysaccharide biosynthesis protein [Methanobacterium sp.]
MSMKTLSNDFVFYGLLNFLQRAIGIIMIPIYTRVLSQNEYGQLDIILIVSSVFCVLVDLQFVVGFSRLYYQYKAAKKGERFAGTIVVSRLIGGIVLPVIFLIMGFLGKLEVSFLPSFKDNVGVWVLMCMSIPVTLTYEIMLLQVRMLRWKKWFAIGALSNCLLACLFSIFFVVGIKLGIVGVLLGLLLGKFIGLLLLSLGLCKDLKLCFDIKAFKELMHYSFPLIPGWWMAFGSAYLCRFFIFDTAGPSENAILAVCMKLASVIGFFNVSFQLAWQPLAMSYIERENSEQFYVRSMRLFIAGGIFSVFCFSAFIGPLLKVFTPSAYSVVQYYFPLFAIGSMLSGCANNLEIGNQIAKRTYLISISSFICVSINFIMLMIFTKRFGIIAAGIAWIISFFAKNVVMYITSQRSHYIAYDKRAFLLFIVGSGILFFLVFCSYNNYITPWLFTSCVALISVILPWFVMVPLERQKTSDILRLKLKNIF